MGKWPGLFLSGALSATAVAGLQLTGEGFMATTDGAPGLRAGFELLLAFGTAAACVTLVTLRPNRISAIGVPLAAFSYTLYLTHYPLLRLLRHRGWERITVLDLRAFALYAVVVLALLAAAWAMYWLFERNTALVRGWIKSSRPLQLTVNER